MSVKSCVKVACLGAGYFSRFHIDAWQRIDAVELCAVCDRDADRENAADVARYLDLASMLHAEKPDVLDIITPPSTHVDAIRRAIDCNVGVIICQKPFCETLEQAIAMTEHVQQAGGTLIVHENFRFQPWYRRIRQVLDEHLLGTVQQAHFRFRTGDGQGPDAYLDRQPYFQTMKRLLIHETGVHYIDVFRYLFGEPTAVYADLRRLNPVIAGEDAGLMVFDFPGQVQAVFDGNRHLDFAAVDTRLTFGELLVEGSEASVTLFGDGRLTLRQFGSKRQRRLMQPQAWPGFAGDSVHALQYHVVRHLIDGLPVENTARDYLRVLDLEQAVYRSSQTGCKIALDS